MSLDIQEDYVKQFFAEYMIKHSHCPTLKRVEQLIRDLIPEVELVPPERKAESDKIVTETVELILTIYKEKS